MKTIPLTQGKVAFVDDEDFERLNRHKWYAWKSRHAFYARRNSSRTETGKRRGILMHRELLGHPASKIDHRDRNGLNNQRKNIRLATNQQNGVNSKRASRSGFKGVVWNPRANKWEAAAYVGGMRKYLGLFNSARSAAHAYDAAAIKLFGEFASLNFQPTTKV